ncbi:hypothetical protein [Vreelandella alkaliphila]|uniref:hypothetical protein n=1 Tax=Vreelandella alkaliphila TaxID=272774 RepID=UPI003FD79D18
MDNQLLNLPADAPAHQAWLELWRLGFSIPHPTDTQQTAAQWLTALALTDSLLKKIYLTAIEAQEGQTV